MGISLDKASLIALFLGILFYGVFFTLYLLTLLILLKKTGIQRQLLIQVATLLLCTTTAHLIVDFVRALEAFVFKTDSIDANAYYSNFWNSQKLPFTSHKQLLPVVSLFGGVMWSPLVAFRGCIVLLTSGAIGYYIVWSLSMTTTVSSTSDGCITTFITLTLVIGVTCTSGSAVFLPVFIVIVASGALYATSVLALLLAFLLGSNGQYTILDVIPPIVVGNLRLNGPLKPGILSGQFDGFQCRTDHYGGDGAQLDMMQNQWFTWRVFWEIGPSSAVP